jgi:hypothetical protein
VWIKNGNGAFESTVRPLQGCVDPIGIYPESKNLDAFLYEKPKDKKGTDNDNKKGDVESVLDKRTSVKLESELSQISDEIFTAYKIEVKPYSVLNLNLCFSPSSSRSSSPSNMINSRNKQSSQKFSLFFLLSANQSQSSDLKLVSTVKAVVIPSILSILPRSLSFGTRVISSAHKGLHRLNISLINADYDDTSARGNYSNVNSDGENDRNSGINWKIDTEDLRTSDVFSISPTEGQIPQNDQINLEVVFTPKESKEYNAVVPVILNGQKNEFYNIELSGQGFYPLILFEPKEVFFPPVPLGFEIKQTIYIRIVGIDNLDIQYQLPVESNLFPFKVDFPDGISLSLNKQVIPCTIVFSSKKAISFTTHISFFDNNGASYPLLIHGVADNCILTNASYYLNTSKNFSVVLDKFDGIPYLKEIFSHSSKLDLSSSNPSNFDSLSISQTSFPISSEIYPPPSSSTISSVLLRFLNLFILRTPLSVWPKGAIESYGIPVFEALEDMLLKSQSSGKNKTKSKDPKSGKLIPGRFIVDKIQAASNSTIISNTEDCELFVVISNKYTFVDPANPKLTFSNNSNSLFELPFSVVSIFGIDSLFYQQIKTGRKSGGDSTPRLELNQEMDCLNVKAVVYNERVLLLLSHYESLISYVKQYNGMISFIRSEYLLDYQDFLVVVTAKIFFTPYIYPKPDFNKLLYGFKTNQNLKDAFKIVSSSSWTFLAFQLIKLFVFSKITISKIQSLPNFQSLFEELKNPSSENKKQISKQTNLNLGKSNEIAHTSNEPINADDLFSSKVSTNSYISQSNIFSSAEVLLLRWISYTILKSPGKKLTKPIINFSSDLSDGTVILRLIRAHVQFMRVSIVENPSTTMEKLVNASTILKVLKVLGMDIIVSESDIVHPDPRSMCLFIYQLFSFLPYCFPHPEIVEISASAGLSGTRTITVKNPLKSKCISYSGKYEGSFEFYFPTSNNLTVEPGGDSEFVIGVKPKFSKPITGTLILTPKNSTGVQLPPLIFNLRTIINGMHSSGGVSVQSQLYSLAYADIKIQNPFEEEATFFIRIKYEKEKNEVMNYLPFILNTLSVHLGPKGVSSLQLKYMPIMLGTQKCSLVFSNENLGEFTQDVEGISVPSTSSSDNFLLVSVSGSSKTQDLNISLRNSMLDLIRVDNSNVEKSLIQALINSRSDKVVYKIEFTSPHFSGPKEITLPGSVLTNVGDSKTSTNSLESTVRISPNKKLNTFRIPISFNPKSPGEYSSKLLLISPFDVRVYEINGIGLYPDIHVDVEMTAHSRQTVSQEIPIQNNSHTECYFISSINPTNTAAGKSSVDCVFRGIKEFKVKPKETYYYSIQYSPTRAAHATAELLIQNVTLQTSISTLVSTQASTSGPSSSSTAEFVSSSWERMVAALGGEGLPPPPEKPDILVDCIANISEKKTVKVPPITPKTNTTYKVICDLTSCIGSSKHVVEYEKDILISDNYELTINSIHAGTEKGFYLFIL